MGVLIIIEAILCFISALVSAVLGVLLIVHRRSKIYYRLCIGLCISNLIVNLLCGIELLVMIVHIEIVSAFHVSAMGVSVLYITAIFFHYFLKMRGFSEEILNNKDFFIHPFIWIFGVGAFFAAYGDNTIANILICAFLGLAAITCIAITVYILIHQMQSYYSTGEVQSALITSRVRGRIVHFQARLVLLLLLAIAVASNMILIIIMDFVQFSDTVSDAILMTCSVTGFVSISILATAPELKRYFKYRRVAKKDYIGSLN